MQTEIFSQVVVSLLIQDDEQFKGCKEHFTTILNGTASGEVPPHVEDMVSLGNMWAQTAPPKRSEITLALGPSRVKPLILTIFLRSFSMQLLKSLHSCYSHTFVNAGNLNGEEQVKFYSLPGK